MPYERCVIVDCGVCLFNSDIVEDCRGGYCPHFRAKDGATCEAFEKGAYADKPACDVVAGDVVIYGDCRDEVITESGCVRAAKAAGS